MGEKGFEPPASSLRNRYLSWMERNRVRRSRKRKELKHSQGFTKVQTTLDGFALRSSQLHRRGDQSYGTTYGTKSGHIRQRVCNRLWESASLCCHILAEKLSLFQDGLGRFFSLVRGITILAKDAFHHRAEFIFRAKKGRCRFLVSVSMSETQTSCFAFIVVQVPAAETP